MGTLPVTRPAHRHFPNRQSLWADVAWLVAQREFRNFLDDLPDDPEERMDVVVREVARMQFGDEAVWRGVVRAAADRWFGQLETSEADRVPTRGANRLEKARIALEPLRKTLPPSRFDRLVHSVVMVFGVEAMITTRDTCDLDPEAATEVMRWAASALVRAAIAEA